MGALHEGHLSLIRAAHELADEVWVSIFVNPAQFGPNEDLDRYPRPIEDDLAACHREGVAAVFMPEPDEVYPPGLIPALVDVPAITQGFEGQHRPGHFAGVCRVVLKLLNLCQPSVACFGQKDYQQLIAVQAMVADLNLPVAIQAVPTVRESDGLAMSSRNRYLEPDQRQHAVALIKALRLAEQMIQDDGHLEPAPIEAAMRQTLLAHRVEPDYAAIRHPQTLEPVDVIDRSVVALIAGRLGPVRLLDNLIIRV